MISLDLSAERQTRKLWLVSDHMRDREQGRMVDALTQHGDEGRGIAAKSLGEVLSNLRSGNVRMGKPL